MWPRQTYSLIPPKVHYHDVSELLQEVIQNADDAGATEVIFFLDCRLLQTLLPGLVTGTDKHVELSRFCVQL